MKKTFGAKIGFVPYASVIIGTYDENNNPDAMNVGWAMQVGSKEVGNTRIVGRIKETTIDDQYIGEDGIPQVRKMNIVWFEDTSKDYIMMGETDGKAFSVGKTLMK